MIENLSKTRRNVALAAIAIVLVWFSWTVRSVLNPLVLGYILASTLHPMVRKVERKGWSRRAAANLIFIAFSVVLVTVGFGVYVQGRMMVRDVMDADIDLVGRVERSFDVFVDDHRDWFETLLPEDEPEGEAGETVEGAPVEGGPVEGGQAEGGQVEGKPVEGEPVMGELVDGGPVEGAPGTVVTPDAKQLAQGADIDAAHEPTGAASEGETDALAAAGDETASDEADESGSFADLLRGGWQALSNEQAGAGKMALKGAGSAWSLLQSWFGSVLGFLTLIVLLPIYTYFLLFELGRIRRFFRRYLPVNERRRVSHVASQIGEVLANFFRGRLLICFLKGGIIAVGLALVGIPYPLLIGMSSGFLALVPFVGPLIGFTAAFSMGLLPPDAEFLGTLIRASIVFGLAEVIEGYVLVPKILGTSLGLHPVVVLVSVFIGGAALGVFGMLIAIPLAACLVILTREFVLPALAQFADEADDGEGDGSTPALAGATGGAQLEVAPEAAASDGDEASAEPESGTGPEGKSGV